MLLLDTFHVAVSHDTHNLFVIFEDRESGKVLLIAQEVTVGVAFAHEPVTCISESGSFQAILLCDQCLALRMCFCPVYHASSIVKIVSRLLEITSHILLLRLLIFFPLRNPVVVIEVFVDDEIVVFDITHCLMLIDRDELLHLGPVLVSPLTALFKVNPISYLLIDCRVEDQLLFALARLHFLIASLCFSSNLHTVGIARRFHDAPLDDLINDCLLLSILVLGLHDLFYHMITGRLVVHIGDAAFDIGIRGEGHLGLGIHIMLDSRVLFQKREMFLDGILIAVISLLLVLFAVAEFLVDILEK